MRSFLTAGTIPLHYNDGRPRRLDHRILTPAVQRLPGFHIVPRPTPREWNGMWFIIDF